MSLTSMSNLSVVTNIFAQVEKERNAVALELDETQQQLATDQNEKLTLEKQGKMIQVIPPSLELKTSNKQSFLLSKPYMTLKGGLRNFKGPSMRQMGLRGRSTWRTVTFSTSLRKQRELQSHCPRTGAA